MILEELSSCSASFAQVLGKSYGSTQRRLTVTTRRALLRPCAPFHMAIRLCDRLQKLLFFFTASPLHPNPQHVGRSRSATSRSPSGPLFVGFGVFPLWDGGYGNPLTAQRSELSAANGQAFSTDKGGTGLLLGLRVAVAISSPLPFWPVAGRTLMVWILHINKPNSGLRNPASLRPPLPHALTPRGAAAAALAECVAPGFVCLAAWWVFAHRGCCRVLFSLQSTLVPQQQRQALHRLSWPARIPIDSVHSGTVVAGER